MSKYKPLDWLLIRSAFLSNEEGTHFLQSTDTVLSALEDPLIAEIISAAAPSLFAQLKANQKENKTDTDLNMALFNVISRMTYRSIPFSCFAGVSLGHFDSTNREDGIFFEDKENCLRSFELKESKSFHTSKVFINPTLTFENGIAKYLKEIPIDHQSQPAKKYTQYFTTRIPNELIKKINEDSNSLSPKLKDHLIGMQILWPKINQKKDLQKKIEFQTLGESTKSSDKKTIESHIIELYRPCKKSTIDSSIADSLLMGADLLMKLFGDQESPLDQLFGHFHKRYESREIPLLELLNPESTFSLKFLQKISEVFSATKREPLEIEKSLMDLILAPEVIESGVLILKKSDVEFLTKTKEKSDRPQKKLHVDSFAIISEIVQINDLDKKFHLKYLNGPHAIGHFARYLKLNPDLMSKVQSMINKEKALYENVIFAELLHKADDIKLNSIMPLTNLYEAVIPISLQNKNKNQSEIELRDLYVSIQKGKFNLKSKKLNKEVMPVLSNLYNFQKDSNPILQFLAYIEMQNSFNGLSWDWGTLTRMPFLPRIEFQKVILAPARWRITAAMSHDFLKSDKDLIEIRNFLKKYNLPDLFELMEDPGVKLRFDQKNDLSMKSLRKILLKNKNKDFFFQEIFATNSIKGTEGSFSHDLIIPYIKHFNEKQNSLIHFPILKEQDRSFPPGSEWNYLNIYLPLSQIDLFLVKHLKPYLKKHNAQWFFIQYTDPEFHIRLRLKGNLLKSLIQFSQALIKTGVCSHFNILTYNREIERYGGLKGCKIFEKISQYDSEAVIKFAEISQNSKMSKIEIWALAALISTKMYLESFECDEEEAISFMGSDTIPPELKNGSIKIFLNKFKTYELAKTKNVPREYHLLGAIYRERALNQKRTINSLNKLFQTHQIYTSKKDYFRSLIHLSLVRLNYDFDREYEFTIFNTIKELIMIEKKRND